MTNEQIEELMREICSTPLLTPEEESELLEKIQAKDADCDEMRKLEKANMRFVVSLATQYQNQGLELEELISIGNEGLLEAAVKYEPNPDSKFISFIVPIIRQRILQAIESKA